MAAIILIVDDDPHLREGFARLLAEEGYDARVAASAEEGLHLMREAMPDCVIMDVRMPDMSGLDALERMRLLPDCPPVIIMTAYSGTDTAIRAMGLGAFDYILKPFDIPGALELISRALEAGQRLRAPAPGAPPALEEAATAEGMVGDSPAMQALCKAIGRVAPTDALVLIRGESGTGKELAARALWRYSLRSHRPFSVINCVAIPDTLLESELFGYEKGAFTGAQARHEGRIEQAAGGTLFLDEIGDIPLSLQAKLLRLLQEKQIQRLGGNETIAVDVRIIAATNADLERAVAEGRFREDLYYRLKVITLWTPPLRDRLEDVPALTETLLRRTAADMGRPNPGIEEAALLWLQSRSWPGNVRELGNALQKAFVFNDGTPLRLPDVRQAVEGRPHSPRHPDPLSDTLSAASTSPPHAAPLSARGEAPSPDRPGPTGDAGNLAAIIRRILDDGEPAPFDRCMDVMGRAVVLEALRQCGGNRSRAARLLGLSRPTLLARMDRYGLKVETRISDNAG